MTPQLPLSILPSFEQLEISINDLKIISEKLDIFAKRVEKSINTINARLENIKGKVGTSDRRFFHSDFFRW